MTVGEKVGMPLDEFIEQTNDVIFEIINGRRILRLPTVAGHSEALNKFFQLLLFLDEVQVGIAFATGTYVLLDQYDSNWVTASRTPDLLFLSAEHWSNYVTTYPNWGDVPLLIIPDMVIEIIAPTDLYSFIDEKMDTYLADGVRLIVIVDPWRHKAAIHAPDMKQPLHLAGDDLIDLNRVISGFQIPLSRLFE